jgi:hypothetical protein
VGALPAYRKTPTMPEALVRPNLNLAFDVLGDFTPQITFDSQVGIDVLTDVDDLTIGEIPYLSPSIDIEVIEDYVRGPISHTKYVGETNLYTLISRKVSSRNTSHKSITPDAAYGAGWNKPPTHVRADG